jgi:oxygen-dependent protoporphyrinogen oxidase
MKLVVVGGGIAGLAAAHRAVEISRESGRAVDLILLEASDRLGGTIQTERRQGFLVECGPDSFLSEKPWALALCRRLGIEERLVRASARFRRTFVVRDGRLHPLPEGFLLLAPTRFWPLVTSGLFSWRGKLRMAMDLLLPRAGGSGDESLGAFVTRRLGREALERAAQPLMAGIYTADPDQLSLAATMPRFCEMERADRSLILALWRRSRQNASAGDGPLNDGTGARWSLFVTLRDGMEDLISHLAERLPSGSIRLNAPVTGVAIDRNGRWRLMTAGGERYEADGVILSTPAYRTARILDDLDHEIERLLDGIPYASSATVTLAYRREDLLHPLDGFGFVVPEIERRPIIACTFSSVKYPGRAPEGYVLLRVFMGGALNEAVLERDDEALARTAHEQVVELLGARAAPLLTRVARHPRAMPQYCLGHLERVGEIERRLACYRGLALAGGAYRGVGISDCVRSGEEAAERLLG